VAETDLVASVTEVAVNLTVLPVGIAAGAEKSVATPLGELATLKDPQRPALPQVTVQVTPAFAESFATNAVIPVPPETCSEPTLGPSVTAIGGGVVLVRLKLAGVGTPPTEAATL
jgi:hypothetical protein